LPACRSDSAAPSPRYRGHAALIAWIALAAITALRLIVAWASPMSPDEAYYWVWSRALAPGYLDHPPMVALFIRAGTALLGEGDLGVRLLSPLAAAIGSLLLAQTGRDLFPGTRAGLWAAVLLNATLLFAAGAATMTPDTPLLLFWAATLWALARLHATGRGAWWLAAGIAAGLAMASKYTAFLLGPAILLWLVWSPGMRSWLRSPLPYLAAALAFLVFLPVLEWNAAHGWASFLKQGGRVGDWSPARAAQFVLELLGGQIGLATPPIALLGGAGVAIALRRGWRGDPAWTLLAATSAIPCAVFLEHALGDRVQANWPAIVYPSALLAAAAGLSVRWRRWFAPSALVGLALGLAVWTQATLAPLALPMLWDPTLLRLGGWADLAKQIDEAATSQGAEFVVDDNYGQAALLAWLLPRDRIVMGLDPRWSLFDLPQPNASMEGRVGLLVRTARRGDTPESPAWTAIERLGAIARTRNGMVAEEFRLYRVAASGQTQGLAVMPRPKDPP
jgi:4-amino-4-deoxy-L-arabinose transferase-like glycosyltransferase